MKTCIFSENSVQGYIPSDYINSRVEFCWAVALNALMCPLNDIHNVKCDIAIFILPKKTREYDRLPIVYKSMFPNCKVGIMQEGPINYYLKYSPVEQLQWIWVLNNVDFNLVHNTADMSYLTSIVNNKRIGVLPTIYNDNITPEPLKYSQRNRIMLSGNMSEWYNGTYALSILLDLKKQNQIPDLEICITKSGRMNYSEESCLKSLGVNVLPWMLWGDWIHELNKSVLGINLMETRAAGTFNLNCAILQIPCIGFDDLDTQINSFDSFLNIAKSNYHNKFNINVREIIKTILCNNDNNITHILSYNNNTISYKKPHLLELLNDI